jgi:two-component system sensor histidine kinase BarA
MNRQRWTFSRLWPERLGPRLALLLVMSAGLSAALAMLSMLVIAWISAESHARAESRQVATTLAYSLAAPLAFSDSEGVNEALRTLSSRTDIRAAWLHDAEDLLVRAYGEDADTAPGPVGGGLWQSQLVVTEPVVAGNGLDRIGTVTLKMDLSGTRDDLRRQAIVASLAALSALLVTIGLSQRLARRISVPIVQLAAAARTLTTDWHLHRPLRVDAGGEVGVALNAFNQMVEELASRDAALQRLNAELRESVLAADGARQQAEAASVAKTRFLANMSHELRSPLNGVIGAAQLLQSAGDDPVRHAELVHIIRTSGNNLLDLIENVLDVSRIEAGKLQIQRQPFDLIHSVETALAPAVAMAAMKGLELGCYIDAGVPRWCDGDGARVRQLVQNLLGNAIKFTERGTVSVAVEPDADPAHICFHVADSGIGIPAGQIESVFEPFRQGDPSTTRRYGGSGLGLAICRDVARLMGGDVRVVSEPGRGSTFTLRLPLPPVADITMPAAMAQPEVVALETGADRRRSLAALLARLGCPVLMLEDSSALRRALQACASGRVPVVLLALDHPQARDISVAVQAIRPDAVVVGIGAGATGLVSTTLTRPVLLSALESCMQGVAQRGDGQRAGGLQRSVERTGLHRTGSFRASVRMLPGGEPPVANKVLVVEDDQVNQIIVRSMVEQGGFQCDVARSGAEALQRLTAARYDAVLMDWQMPEMDGLEATRRLRSGVAGELNRAVPVIALTANAFAEDRNTCLAAGMNDFLTKPVQGANLLSALQRWCRVRETDPGSDDTSLLADAVAQVAADAATDGDAMPVYDRAVLGSLPMIADGSNPHGARELLTLFIATTRAGLDSLSTSIGCGDVRSVQRFVHTLKSSAGQIGALALAATAAAADQALRGGSAPDPALVSRLQAELGRFETASCTDTASAAAV